MRGPQRTRKRRTVEALPQGLSRCPHCGIYFLPPRSDAIYCGNSCRTLAYRERRIEGAEPTTVLIDDMPQDA